MKTLISADATVLAVVGSQSCRPETGYRPSVYCVVEKCPEGQLLYHSMTGELLLLSEEETPDSLREELVKRRFLVPEDCDEKKQWDQIRGVLRLMQRGSYPVSHYTVFTTTDCNARCYYCFEKGQRRITMTERTARDVAAYMLRQAAGEKIRIRWFGGEPLVNAAAVDVISRCLREAGAEYEGTMVSNAYLFDRDTVERAAQLWNLKHVLITLDGTEQVYNRTKAFIYREGSPFLRVLSNIDLLLDRGIRVTVNLNMDAHNAADLTDLAGELGRRFKGRKGFNARGELLIEYVGKLSPFQSDLQALELRRALQRRLREEGILQRKALGQPYKLNACMADDPRSVTILPDGRIGRCEHFGDREDVGTIYEEAADPVKLASWQELRPAEDACASCALYPQCLRLKKCNACPATCDLLYREQRLDGLRDMMYTTWERGKQTGSREGGQDEDKG